MPYDVISELPNNVRKLPKGAQEIYLGVFNDAFETYKGNEGSAHGAAWAAVKKKYKKDAQGKWVAKESVKEASMAKEAVHPHGEHICVCPKCGETVTVAEDIKCNTQECIKCGTRMRAKDVGERREAMSDEMSDEDKRMLLQQELKVKFSPTGGEMPAFHPAGEIPISMGVWIRDVWDKELVYEVGGQTYKVSYELDKDGNATFGEPEKVAQKTVYEPVESLRLKHGELIQAAGNRDIEADAKKVKATITLCSNVLSSEKIDGDQIKAAIVEVDNALTWLLEQKVMKTEDGEKYPAAAYAYAPDKEKPSGWKLRLWQTPELKVTRSQLGRAAAAFSPGGFRGEKVQLPADAVAKVKRKVRAEYGKLGVKPDEMPKWVKEAAMRELMSSFVSLAEAEIDKGMARVVVIAAGFNTSKDRYYSAEMLARDCHIFEGLKMYADHPTKTEEDDLPERSIKAWVGTLKNVTWDAANNRVMGDAMIVEHWLKEKLALLRDQNMLSDMGISINAVGIGSETKIDDTSTLDVEELVTGKSVDFVTEPGAGGIVISYEADRDMDVDLVNLATLRERRPDLIKVIEEDTKSIVLKEVKVMEQTEEEDKKLIQEKDEQIETLTKERDELAGKITAAENERAIAEAKVGIDKAIAEAKLPEAAKKRLAKQFENASSTEGLEEAIEAEIEYIGELKEAGQVKGMGDTKESTEAGKEVLKESIKSAHPGWTDEQVAAFAK